MTHDSTQRVEPADGSMEIYDVAPEAKASGAIIVIQEAFGVNEHIRDVTRRFAAAGFRAVAPTMFHRAGGGTAPYDDFAKVIPLFAGVSDDGIVADVDAAVTPAPGRDPAGGASEEVPAGRPPPGAVTSARRAGTCRR